MIYMRGQVSAEMLILLAVVIAIVALAATYLMDLGKSAGESVSEQSTIVLHQSQASVLGEIGDPCMDDGDCKSDDCDAPGGTYTCQ